MPSGRQLAYEHLKDTVLSDPAMQGQFVNEQALADEIGVSRTPIREALLLLAAEELVQLVPKRGAYIAPVGGRELRELFEFRTMIECYSARRAVELDAVPLDAMRAELAEQRSLAGEDQARAFIDRDHRFHTALVRAVGNDMLTKTYDGLRARQVRAGIVALFRAGDRRKSVLAEHEAIVAALAARDADAATAAITAHLAATQRVLLEG
ncbi:GntR family transcriptional regulator [Saccharopolyspora rosea]|uniref:GntR family transcriptional regulator n=1 Tax=Saccharopolyspora rosea TaxID=524884 RepID=UPI0021DB0422|nr:GntR family transcriptional regulator [Saccharopolyspora rosea]